VTNRHVAEDFAAVRQPSDMSAEKSRLRAAIKMIMNGFHCRRGRTSDAIIRRYMSWTGTFRVAPRRQFPLIAPGAARSHPFADHVEKSLPVR
jgi:hypothetical protein